MTFNTAFSALLEGKVKYVVNRWGTNRMYLEKGVLRFDYLSRETQSWAPCPSNDPTDDDRSEMWYPVDGEGTND